MSRSSDGVKVFALKDKRELGRAKRIIEGANHFSSRIFQDIWKRMDDDDI